MPEPYISVVVTTRNDDHGGDPLKRLQAFVNTFSAQCAQTGLDAELIVVEWNPPPDRNRVRELLRPPFDCAFPIRFVEVPPDLHATLRHSDVLPLFQMIAKNVGIRRARGRFVLATNIDIIFSTELVSNLALRTLNPGRLYRVNRHDIRPDYPVDSTLDHQQAYCWTHQIRLHERWGTYPVDPRGRKLLGEDDVVSASRGFALGDGWHVREGDTGSGFYRWVKDEARFSLDRRVTRLTGGAVLDIEFESNPYQPDSWFELEIRDGDRPVVRRRVSQRPHLRLALPDGVERHEFVMRMLDSSGGGECLPLLERRDALAYRVRSMRVGVPPAHVYDMAGWRPAYDNPGLEFEQTPDGIAITTGPDKYLYCAHYDGFETPETGTYEFELEYRLTAGHFQLSVLDDERNCWLPSISHEIQSDDARLMRVVADIPKGTKCSLVVSNHRPEGGTSRFVLRRLTASAPSASLIRPRPTPDLEKGRGWPGRAKDMLTAATRQMKRTASDAELQRARRYEDRIVDESERFRELEAHVTEQTPLGDLAPLVRLLRVHRPEHIHENACGDFQLLAREAWERLKGYPEFQTFSMNIDGFFEAVASSAGYAEQVLEEPHCIFHLEHEKGSGWTPEGEALLQQRIAASGITWLDLSAVRVCTTYMQWLGRPMIFNTDDWGFGNESLREFTLQPVTEHR